MSTPIQSTQPTGDDPGLLDELDELADRLEAAWRVAPTTSLDPFLPPAGAPARLRLLHGLIGRDVQIAWRRQQGRMLEQYLKRYPELGPRRDLPAALVFAEYRARLSAGEPASADEYRRRFPEQFPELMRLIEAASDQGDHTGTLLDPRATPSSPSATKPGWSEPAPGAASSHTVAGAPRPSEALPSAVPPPTKTLVNAPWKGGSASSAPTDAQVLPMRDGIKLLKCIGRGQFGEVFLAEAPGGVNVAVKRIFRSLDDESSQRELQALQLIRELRHPFLLQTQAFWSLEDRLVIVMELAEGSLAEWNRDARRATGAGVPVGELLPYFREAAEALDYLHSMNVLHRDVKPANLLRLKGHAKVADFGLARMMESQQLVAATFCGTPLYMAPEVWKQKVHFQSDQYSLAATYAEMRTGRPLFPGPDYGEICRQHALAKPDLAPLEEAEQRVLLRALSKEPERRYPTCRAFADALTAALAPPPAPPAAAPPRRTRPVAVAALALGLLAVLVAVWVVARLSPTPPPAAVVQAPPTPPPPPGPLLPADCQPEGTEQDGRYFKRILHPLAGAPPILFLLIPQKNASEPPPFYVMRDKVSNGQFNAAANEDGMKQLLDEAAKAGSWAVRREWTKEGRGDPAQAALPVVYVTFPEARCFAHFLGGELPTAAQWDKAAGRYDGAEGPYRPGVPPKGLAIAHNRAQIGPIAVGDANGDESVFGCRDMADNGREWTATGRGGAMRLPERLNSSDKVELRGVSFLGDEVFHFKDLDEGGQTTALREEPRHDIGFRVVIEAPRDPP